MKTLRNITVNDLLACVHPDSAHAMFYEDQPDGGRRGLQDVLDYVQGGVYEDGMPEMDTAQGCAQTLFSLCDTKVDINDTIDALSAEHPIQVLLDALRTRIETLSGESIALATQEMSNSRIHAMHAVSSDGNACTSEGEAAK